MRRINTLAELRFEQRALRSKAADLEIVIQNDLQEIKAMFRPLQLVTSGAEKVLTSHNNGILGNSAGLIADFLTRKVLLKNSGFLTKLIVPLLVKNVTSNVVDNNKETIVDWVGGLISRFKDRKKEREEE
ncbi:MAG: hypothetical protein JWP12_3557 [Bacteroidetes bacterium]|nr:hypothetical protein [Bacteroidota bacterium]